MSKELFIERSSPLTFRLKTISEEILSEVDKTGMMLVKNIPSTILGEKNQNGRIYTSSEFNKALSELTNKGVFEARSLLCTADDHPDGTYPKPSQCSHIVVGANVKKVEGKDVLFNDWLVLNTEQGKNLRALIEAGASIGTSIRGLGVQNESNGEINNYEYLGTDVVGNPSAGTFANFEGLSESVLDDICVESVPTTLAESVAESLDLDDLEESYSKDDYEKRVEPEERKILSKHISDWNKKHGLKDYHIYVTGGELVIKRDNKKLKSLKKGTWEKDYPIIFKGLKGESLDLDDLEENKYKNKKRSVLNTDPDDSGHLAVNAKGVVQAVLQVAPSAKEAEKILKNSMAPGKFRDETISLLKKMAKKESTTTTTKSENNEETQMFNLVEAIETFQADYLNEAELSIEAITALLKLEQEVLEHEADMSAFQAFKTSVLGKINSADDEELEDGEKLAKAQKAKSEDILNKTDRHLEGAELVAGQLREQCEELLEENESLKKFKESSSKLISELTKRTKDALSNVQERESSIDDSEKQLVEEVKSVAVEIIEEVQAEAKEAILNLEAKLEQTIKIGDEVSAHFFASKSINEALYARLSEVLGQPVQEQEKQANKEVETISTKEAKIESKIRQRRSDPVSAFHRNGWK